mmetsp:Transcript_4055/g.6247  ORF Transcript_4055/g.6247 Transcript_4055/m.6247 type:complete len:114 (+) Transcript_4055:1054-1395(+)
MMVCEKGLKSRWGAYTRAGQGSAVSGSAVQGQCTAALVLYSRPWPMRCIYEGKAGQGRAVWCRSILPHSLTHSLLFVLHKGLKFQRKVGRHRNPGEGGAKGVDDLIDGGVACH